MKTRHWKALVAMNCWNQSRYTLSWCKKVGVSMELKLSPPLTQKSGCNDDYIQQIRILTLYTIYHTYNEKMGRSSC